MTLFLPSRRFDVVDVSAVARPAALEEWTYQAILAARVATWLRYWNEARLGDPTLPEFDIADIQSDPAIILQRVDAFRESLVRQRVNEAVLATFLLFAQGADLDARAAEVNTIRAAGESDSSLRLRAILAWENLSIGGSYGGYEYQARSVAPVSILDCAVYGHEVAGVALGEVRIVLLGSGGLGATSTSLLAAVNLRFNGADRRSVVKVNDRVTVMAAERVSYAVDATLVVPRGALAQTVQASKLADVTRYCAQRMRIAAPVTFAGVMNALGDDDPAVVLDIRMRAPWSGLVDVANAQPIGGGPFQAPVCTSITIDVEEAA